MVGHFQYLRISSLLLLLWCGRGPLRRDHRVDEELGEVPEDAGHGDEALRAEVRRQEPRNFSQTSFSPLFFAAIDRRIWCPHAMSHLHHWMGTLRAKGRRTTHTTGKMTQHSTNTPIRTPDDKVLLFYLLALRESFWKLATSTVCIGSILTICYQTG